MRLKPRFPCTGHISTEGFSAFLEAETGESRRNLSLLAKELRQTLGTSFLTLVNSGSSANLAAALFVKQRVPDRKKVLMAGFSFPTTIDSFTINGFDVHLVDTEPKGFNICPDTLERSIDSNTAAVVVTHFLGFPARLAKIAAITRNAGAILVQDACETMNLCIENQSLYQFGDVITHSFYHPHHLSSFGGGAVIVQEPEFHHTIQSIVHWGRACRCHYAPEECPAPEGLDHNFWYVREGINVEMSELNACFARWQLQTWQSQEAKRWKHWRIWSETLAPLDRVQIWNPNQTISPFVFPIAVDPARLQTITSALQNEGIELRSLMGGAIHRHPAFRHLAHPNLVQCEEMGDRSFFVGIHQTLDSDMVQEAAHRAHNILHLETNL